MTDDTAHRQVYSNAQVKESMSDWESDGRRWVGTCIFGIRREGTGAAATVFHDISCHHTRGDMHASPHACTTTMDPTRLKRVGMELELYRGARIIASTRETN